MKKFVLAVIFTLISFEASAIVRYIVQDMTCAEVQQALERDGAAILYRKGSGGGSLYDRYVNDASFCGSGKTASWERIAVADTKGCRVARCIDITRFD